MKKKPDAVAAAKAITEAKRLELEAARENVKRLENELGESLREERVARENADSAMPQCRMVRTSRSSTQEADVCRVVILRQTPSGILVTRAVGDTGEVEYKFKRSQYSGKFIQAERRSTFSFYQRELRDVPANFYRAEAGAINRGY